MQTPTRELPARSLCSRTHKSLKQSSLSCTGLSLACCYKPQLLCCSIPVGDESVVYSVPAIYCERACFTQTQLRMAHLCLGDTPRYSRWLTLVIIFLIGDTIGFPLGLGIFLTIR